MWFIFIFAAVVCCVVWWQLATRYNATTFHPETVRALEDLSRSTVEPATEYVAPSTPETAPPVAAKTQDGEECVDGVFVFANPPAVLIRTDKQTYHNRISRIERVQPYNQIHLVLTQAITAERPWGLLSGRRLAFSTAPKNPFYAGSQDSAFRMDGNALRAVRTALGGCDLRFEADDEYGSYTTPVGAVVEIYKPLRVMLGTPVDEEREQSHG